MAENLKELLNTYNANALRQMAENAQLSVTKANSSKRLPKPDLITMLVLNFFTRERVKGSFGRIDDRAQAVLNQLLRKQGDIPTSVFKRQCVRAGLVTEGETASRYSRRRNEGSPLKPESTIFEDVVARLTYHGLVFSRPNKPSYGNMVYKLGFGPGSALLIPEQLRRHLPKPPSPQDRFAEWAPDEISLGDPQLFIRDLYLYWDYVRRHGLALLKNGSVAKRGLKAVNEHLLQPDSLLKTSKSENKTFRLYLLRLILEKADLVAAKGKHLQAKETSFWQQSLGFQIKTAFDVWLQAHDLVESATLERFGSHFHHSRRILINQLKDYKATSWIEQAFVVDDLQERDPNFLVTNRLEIEGYYSDYYYGSVGGKSLSGNRDDLLREIDKGERSFVERALHFLHQLGMVDFGVGQWAGKTITAVNITEFGYKVLHGRRASAPTADEGKVIVQPSFQVLALGAVDLNILAQLDQFAERMKVDRNVFEYRLTRDSVYNAQQAGFSAGKIEAFLTQHTGIPLPQNVRRSLTEWGAHHERIVFRKGVTLMQTASAALLAQLQQQQAIERELTPTLALVQPQKQRQLTQNLLSQTLLPAISGASANTADHSVMIAADGTITPIHAVPTIFLTGRLSQFAEQSQAGSWHLTVETVQRYGVGRETIDRLLRELKRLQRGRLSAELVANIKAWGHYYGQATASTITLIEFEATATRDELCRHPDLRQLLTSFPAGERALATVATDQLSATYSKLEELGVRLTKNAQ